jgi:hypothetical protein
MDQCMSSAVRTATAFLRSYSFSGLCLLGLCIFLETLSLRAQVAPAATRGGRELQAGASFDLGHSDYGTSTLRGLGFYTTDDFRPHLGVELNFHQLYDSNSKTAIYERTYEVGPRYSLKFGPLRPYAKLMIGRGVFQFPPDPLHPKNGPVANLAYTMWSGGFGADYRVKPSMNIRVDYELQRWSGFPPNGLSPRVLSLGVAYHFH